MLPINEGKILFFYVLRSAYIREVNDLDLGLILGTQPLAFMKEAILTSQVTSLHFASVSGSLPPQVFTQDSTEKNRLSLPLQPIKKDEICIKKIVKIVSDVKYDGCCHHQGRRVCT